MLSLEKNGYHIDSAVSVSKRNIGETSTTDLAGTTGTAHLVQIAGLAMQGFADYGKVSQLSLTNLLICCRTSGQIGFLWLQI